MKVDFKAPVLDLEGVQLKDEKGNLITLGKLATGALLNNMNMPDADKSFRQFIVARKVYDGEEITVEDAALIKEVCGKAYGPLPYGRMVEALEGAA